MTFGLFFSKIAKIPLAHKTIKYRFAPNVPNFFSFLLRPPSITVRMRPLVNHKGCHKFYIKILCDAVRGICSSLYNVLFVLFNFFLSRINYSVHYFHWPLGLSMEPRFSPNPFNSKSKFKIQALQPS